MNFEKYIKALEKNNMKVIFCETKEDILKEVKKTLKKGDSLAFGGSVTLSECGVDNLLKNGEYDYLDRFKQGLTDEDKKEIFAKILKCDHYFCSANAVTQNGELINVDGFSN